jgi:hypothetical protein
MDDSILESIKKLLGNEGDTHFDTDIRMHINSALMILAQLGIGTTGFLITGKDELWSDFLADKKDLEAVKSYVYLKVRLLFDPPTVSAVIEAMERQIKEFEWRLNIQADKPVVEGGI